ncbi:MAG: transcription-repair coupling factor, partial [Desulfocucumaceae bacterium]
MRGLLAPLKRMSEYKSICRGLDKKVRQQIIFGLSGSQKAYLAAGLLEHLGGPALLLVPGDQEASTLLDDLSSLLPGKKVLHFPAYQLLPYHVLAAGKETMEARLRVLEALVGREPVVVVATVEAFLRRLAPPEIFSANRLSLNVGDVLEPEKLKIKLIDMGYERCDLVEGRGQFSARGGILDIFPMTFESPVRIEFFDDEVDSVRSFDPDTQRSVQKHRGLTILPAVELVVDDAVRSQSLKRIEVDYKAQIKRINRSGSPDAGRSLAMLYGEAVEKIGAGLYFPGIEQFLPYFYPDPVTLSEYFPADSLILVDEPQRLKELAEVIHRERTETYNDLLSKGRVLTGQYGGYIQWEDLQKSLNRLLAVFVSFLPRRPQSIGPANIVNFPAKGMHAFLGRMDIITDEVSNWKRAGYAVALLAGSGEQ